MSDYFTDFNEDEETPAVAVEDSGVSFGDSGEKVKEVQKAYNAISNSYKLKEDGVYGRRTRAAISNFQNEEGIVPTGEVDEATAQALGL